MKHPKHIIRRSDNSVFAGVCGSMAEYFRIEAKYIRLIYVLLTILTFFFPGFFMYMLLMLIIPKEMTTEQIDELSSE